jgi:uncharacterized membrane protein YdbT with pleckstrin-like domain
VKFGLAVCVALLLAVVWAWQAKDWPAPVLIAGVLPFLAPLKGWVEATRTSLAVEGSVVRLKEGLVSESMKAMDLSKLQNVFVERSAGQRMWGVGTLILETASEHGRIVIENIDRPQEVADLILKASRGEVKI